MVGEKFGLLSLKRQISVCCGGFWSRGHDPGLLLLLLERAGDLNLLSGLLLSGLKALSFSLLAEGLDFLLEA